MLSGVIREQGGAGDERSTARRAAGPAPADVGQARPTGHRAGGGPDRRGRRRLPAARGRDRRRLIPAAHSSPGYGGALSATTAPRLPMGRSGPTVESCTVCRSASALTAAPTITRNTVTHTQNMLIATPASEPYVDS